MPSILDSAARRVNHLTIMDDILSEASLEAARRRFAQTGSPRPGEPESLRAREIPVTVRAAVWPDPSAHERAREAVCLHQAAVTEGGPLAETAAWLLAQLPGLLSVGAASDVVRVTVARSGAGATLTLAERIIVDAWDGFVAAQQARKAGNRG